MVVSESIKAAINLAAAISAFVAAGLWWWASVQVAPPREIIDGQGWTQAQIPRTDAKGDGMDPIETGVRSARWNQWASMAAGLGALLQGIALLPGP